MAQALKAAIADKKPQNPSASSVAKPNTDESSVATSTSASAPNPVSAPAATPTAVSTSALVSTPEPTPVPRQNKPQVRPSQGTKQARQQVQQKQQQGAQPERPEPQVRQLPPIEFDTELPVSARRDEIAKAIEQHQIIIVSGETGSGKTTQLPKICLQLGRGQSGLIGHTQPRRIAAVSRRCRRPRSLRLQARSSAPRPCSARH